jgi:hypothetical protein
MTKKPQKEKEIELESDAWQRFERAVDVVAKSPPQHRVKAKPKKSKVSGKKKR